MQIHQSAEDYLETILMLTQRMGRVRSIDVVNELGYTKASVSIAMKKLRENGYIAVDGEGNLTLLEPGREIAERIYSRHRLLTHFFVQLGVDEDVAAEDACKAEHILSEQTLKKIREYALLHDAEDSVQRSSAVIWPARSRRRCLSSVRICSSSTTLSLARPVSSARMLMWVGSRALSSRDVMAAAMTVGLCRLPISFCTMSTGRTPPCSEPTTGERSA